MVRAGWPGSHEVLMDSTKQQSVQTAQRSWRAENWQQSCEEEPLEKEAQAPVFESNVCSYTESSYQKAHPSW